MQRTIRWPSAKTIVAAVLVALTVAFARGVPWGDVMIQLRHASFGWLAAAVVATCLTLLVRAVMWWGLVREIGVRSFVLALRGVLAMAALNSVAIGAAGEVGRAVLVTRESGARGTAIVATIALDHFLATLVHTLAAICIGFVLPLPDALERYRMIALGILAALGVAIALVMRAPHAERGREGLVSGFGRGVREFVETIQRVTSGRRLAISLALMMFWWCLGLVTIHWTALALGLRIPLGVSAVAFLMVSAGNIAHATPGNVGVMQMVYASTVHMLGVPLDQAVGVAILFQAIQTVPVVLAALPLLPAFLRACSAVRCSAPAAARDATPALPTEGGRAALSFSESSA